MGNTLYFWRRAWDSMGSAHRLLRNPRLCSASPRGFESLKLYEKTKSTTPLGNTLYFWRRAWDSNPRNGFGRLHDFQSCSFDQLGQLSIYSSKHFQSALILYIIDYKKSRVNLYFLSNFKEVKSTRNILHSNFCRNIISSMI